MAEFENTRISALVWRWAGDDLLAPSYWEISFSTWTWNLTTSYYTKNDFTSWEDEEWEYKENIYSMFEISGNYNIEKIICTKDSENWLAAWDIWKIRFEWSKYSLEWDCSNNNTYQKVSFLISYKWFQETIEFDAVSWLIERKK